MATAIQIKRMQSAMLACGVSAELIEAAVAQVSEAGFFAAPAIAGTGPREATLFFENQFWPNYPRRDGRNPKEPAKKLLIGVIVSGENPGLILAGVQRLTQELGRRHKIGTEYVPMATTWIRGRGWKDDPMPDPPPLSPSGGRGGPQMGFYGAAAQIRSRGGDG